MSKWEASGKSDEWFTPAYIMDALGCRFDLDVAAPIDGPRHLFSYNWYHRIDRSLSRRWYGFVWMNPPYGGRNALMPWGQKFITHGNGIALLPDRTSAPWFKPLAQADALCFVHSKIKFERPDGTLGESPGNGSVLVACGEKAELALMRANGVIGWTMTPIGIAA